ncbi:MULTISPECIES: NO-inducible flavohemoprotein [unclassified Thioalkalivibrio]|uniref:NO-inducible flavohemoprotein n=1 Tax=unclassified Thioalkalivibrio TaxID=2621013 RepID=UPI00035EB913|nr:MULTISPECIES: NO-inducible flavohemoprotein [unclassified Thioalkalivibrio]
MLSTEQKAIIQQTVPILEAGGEALTGHFYRIMLRDHPEVRPLFNQAHQASGEQSRALANAVLNYARHIDQLESLGPLVGQIVNKHVSLQVQPEHYPIVGGCLLQAMREVLGEAVATDAVLDAWAAAYQQLADILIAAEEQANAANEQQPGGWRGARPFRVQRKVPESEEITSFYLQPVDGQPVPPHQAGQYLGLRLMIEGEELRRNYSLSAAANGETLRISVKREPGGVASTFLHDRVDAGDILDVFPPAGDFVLRPADRPVAFVTAGVGITPAVAMTEAALAQGREVHFVHCARHGGVHAFRDWLNAQAERTAKLTQRYCYSEPRPSDAPHAEGFLSREQLAEWLPDSREVDVYFLGPRPFMQQVRAHLRGMGIPDAQVNYEFFGPASALE